ncbi:hypothetical protein BASA81_012098 [Batrachochytrium salamandrivorans]|nr:hypothetical protein BASA81_012098 [Batrachochytrium salamandrivorans]
MLGGDLSSQILAAIASKLAKDYPFPVLSHDGSLSWKEAAKAYMLGSLSTIYLVILVLQIVVQPPLFLIWVAAPHRLCLNPTCPPIPLVVGHLIKGPHRSDLSFGGVVYSLYQHSYDGYGLRAGRSKLLGISADGSPEDGKTALLQPCVRKGREVEIIASDHIERLLAQQTALVLASGSSLPTCLNQSASRCKLSPPLRTCSFDGIYMPTLTTTFAENEMEAAEMVCKGDTSHLTALGKQFYQENPHWCMDLGFMHQLLATGYGLPDSRPMKRRKRLTELRLAGHLAQQFKSWIL